MSGMGLGSSLPDISARITVDDSQLTKVSATSAKTGAAIAGHMQTSTAHTLRFEQSLSTLASHFGGLPPIADQAARSIESMASTGVTGMGLLGGAALVAVGAVAEVVNTSIQKYEELGSQVENYRRVVGGSAEESGRMVQTFQALGVGADTATAGMFKLSKAAETSPAKLEALGVSIAHDAAGNIDLSKTLFNVADAYNAATDQGKKNLILFDAFGKSGKDMIPILEQGSVALQNLEAQARLTFTDADLQRLKELNIKQAEAKQGWDAMWQSIGQKLVPAESALWDSINRGSYVQQRLNEDVAAGRISQDQLTFASMEQDPVVAALTAKYDAQFAASQKLKGAIDETTAATQAATQANDALWTSLDKVVSQEEAAMNAKFASQRADLAVLESQPKVTKATEDYYAALAKYGANSDEAILAAQTIAKAQIDQEQSYYAAAAAARKLQEDTDVAATGQKNASLDAQAYIDKLQAEADTLAPDSALRVRLQAYIDKLKNEVPATVTTRFITEYVSVDQTTGRALGATIGLTAAGGGDFQPGAPVLVGEEGPEIWTPKEAGTITPHGQLPASSPSGTDGMAGGDPDIVRLLTIIAENGKIAASHLSGLAGQPRLSASLAVGRAG